MYFKNKTWMALALSLVMMFSLIAGCGGGGDSDKAAGDNIKLGFLGATTGSVANYGIPGEKGMKLAI